MQDLPQTDEAVAEVLRNAAIVRARRAALARIDPNEFAQFVLRDDETGGRIYQSVVHRAWHRQCDLSDRVVLWSHVESGKHLTLDTPIPTPTGWKLNGDLVRGDVVLGRDGMPCTVLQAHAVVQRPRMYRVKFDDGTELLAGADHLWLAGHYRDFTKRPPISMRHAGDGDPCACGCGMNARRGKRYVHNHHRRHGRSPANPWRVVNTQAMLDAGVLFKATAGPASVWRVPLTEALDLPEVALPVDPYVLGAWLGDGNSNSPGLTFHRDDIEIWRECIMREGGDCEPYPDKRNPNTLHANIGGFHSKRRNHDPTRLRLRLRDLGVLGNKHIPVMYLRAAEAQRLELLAGLLDTDGTVGKRGQGVAFDNTNERLARGTLELVRSLGIKAHISDRDSVLNGVVHGKAYHVAFTARVPVFKLERKLKRQQQRLGPRKQGSADFKFVTAIEPMASVPARCITVDSPDSTYLAGDGFTVTHNTSQISIGRALWCIGKDPTLRIAVVSNTHGQAAKPVRAARRIIERSPEFARVFPDIQMGEPWTDAAFTVERSTYAKDPTLQATGLHGNILGARLDGVIFDDVLDFENTKNPAQRDDAWNWIQATILGRLTRRAWVWVVGNAWHPDDVMHRFARLKGWSARRYPVVAPDGTSLWPDAWPDARIAEKRDLFTPPEFARQMMCVARSESGAKFKKEWIDRCKAEGNGYRMYRDLDDLLEAEVEVRDWYEKGEIHFFTGVDLGVQRHASADLTCLFTIMVWPDGARQPVRVESGRWSGPDIIERIHGTLKRFPTRMRVENNAAQQFIIDFAEERTRLPITPHTTGRNKAHPDYGVESLGGEFEKGKWVIPNDDGRLDPEIAAWIKEMLYYDPNAHTGDRLMGAWFSREEARARLSRSGSSGFLL